MNSNEIWSNYIRYIGAGAVGTGGIFHLFKVIPLLGKAIKDGFNELFKKQSHRQNLDRTNLDISMKWLIIAVIGVAIILFAVPYLSFNLFSIALLLILSLFFVAVSSIACGVVGSSSNPISGMLITVLLITCGIYLLLGWTERIYLFSSITLSVVACVAIGLAGNTSQDLKTGFILGSTPWKQQISQLIGLIVPALIVGITVYTLNATYKIGSVLMPAPQANLLAMLAQGVMEKDLPVGLVGAGVMLALILFLLKIPVIPFAIGLYLPLFLTSGIFIGGLVRFLSTRNKADDLGKGTLFSSGLVGGDSLFGVLIAILSVIGWIPISAPYALPDFVGPIFYLSLGLLTYIISKNNRNI
jgi:putative OPT family oligopeptide transporter